MKQGRRKQYTGGWYSSLVEPGNVGRAFGLSFQPGSRAVEEAEEEKALSKNHGP